MQISYTRQRPLSTTRIYRCIDQLDRIIRKTIRLSCTFRATSEIEKRAGQCFEQVTGLKSLRLAARHVLSTHTKNHIHHSCELMIVD